MACILAETIQSNGHTLQLKLDSMTPPELIEVEVRKPSTCTPNYDLIEKYDVDTVTRKRTEKKPTFASQTSKSQYTVRLTCFGNNTESTKGGRGDGERAMKRIKV